MIKLALLLSTSAALAATPAEKVSQTIHAASIPGVMRVDIGITRQLTPIPALITDDDLDYQTKKTRILLIGGLDGADASVQSTLRALKWFYSAAEARDLRKRFAVSAVPVANPDRWAEAGGTGDPTRGYPPQGDAYSSPTDPEAAYLWRWIGMHAPDFVVTDRSPELAGQLGQAAPSGTGTIPAMKIDGPHHTLLSKLLSRKFDAPSPARAEIQRRIARSPLQIARQLSDVYGHQLSEVVYIPAVALIGRLRLGYLADVESIVAPYYSGAKAALENPTGSHLSGHLVFGELARRTSQQRYLDLARAAADLGFDQNGQPQPAMPFHSEMSDSVFMGCPILAQVGQLTGETRYFDMCLRHMRFMLDLNLRPDGLHRHSPLDPTAWGRGNAFPALGLAWGLDELPKNHPGRPEILKAFQAHMAVLAKHQDETGMWHQVVDLPASYREFTATCMIAYAMRRGVRSGWLDAKTYEPQITRAWYAIRARIALDGSLVDVCTGTGKQKSLRDYLDRTAILGRDDRGGAMALLIATEMAGAAK